MKIDKKFSQGMLKIFRSAPHVTNRDLALKLSCSEFKIKMYIRHLVEIGAIVCNTRKVKLSSWSNQRTITLAED